MLMLVLSVVAVNVRVAASGPLPVPWPLLFPRPFAVGAPVLALLGAGLAASAGVLVSLRASSVRQAAQSLNVAILVLMLVPIVVFQVLSDATVSQLGAWAASAGAWRIIWAAAAALAALDAVLLAAALGRFRRARLILD
jgi:ABC-2 type transport system permease protein